MTENDGNKTLALSHTTFRAYLECPKKYLTLIKDTPLEVPEATESDLYNNAFGNTMHSLTEKFYNEGLYRRCGTLDGVRDVYIKLRDSIEDQMKVHLRGVTMGVKFRPLTWEEFRARCAKAIKRFVANVVKHRLWGVYTKAEINLSLRLDKYNLALFGKPDLGIVQRNPHKIIIVDVKSRPNTTVDDSQLIWYALMWYYKWGDWPTDLYFMYMEGEPDMEPVSFRPEMGQELMSQILVVRDKIQADKKFRPVRNEKCWNCLLRKTCEESPYAARMQVKKELEKASKPFKFGEGDSSDPLEGIFSD